MEWGLCKERGEKVNKKRKRELEEWENVGSMIMKGLIRLAKRFKIIRN